MGIHCSKELSVSMLRPTLFAVWLKGDVRLPVGKDLLGGAQISKGQRPVSCFGTATKISMERWDTQMSITFWEALQIPEDAGISR